MRSAADPPDWPFAGDSPIDATKTKALRTHPLKMLAQDMFNPVLLTALLQRWLFCGKQATLTRQIKGAAKITVIDPLTNAIMALRLGWLFRDPEF